jgi:hypothetical protein
MRLGFGCRSDKIEAKYCSTKEIWNSVRFQGLYMLLVSGVVLAELGWNPPWNSTNRGVGRKTGRGRHIGHAGYSDQLK